MILWGKNYTRLGFCLDFFLTLDVDSLTGMGWKVLVRCVFAAPESCWLKNTKWSHEPATVIEYHTPRKCMEMWHDACFKMIPRCNDRINLLIFGKSQQCWHGNHWPIKIDGWNTSIIRQRFFVNLMLSPKPLISLDTPWLSRHVGIGGFHRHEESAGGRGTWQIRFS